MEILPDFIISFSLISTLLIKILLRFLFLKYFLVNVSDDVFFLCFTVAIMFYGVFNND